MKKSFFAIAILLSLFTVVTSSCNNNNNNNSATGTKDNSGTYQLVMDGNIVAEGTSSQKVLMSANTVNLGGAGSDFVITITNVPVTIGADITISESSGENGDRCQLTISGNNLLDNGADEMYWGKSGTVTRTSASKISFQGIVKADASATITHTFSGNIESDAYKVN
ncbi:MAG: hypothetical protein PF448_08270 [Bacteroidales bacterium]|jgi:hypothetical protein|nr:hypothetical protein [Bacteroidales bacterium]